MKLRWVLILAGVCLLGARANRVWADPNDPANPYYCMPDDPSYANPKCSMPLASSTTGSCWCYWAGADPCDIDQAPSFTYVLVGYSSAACCMDFNGNHCCHIADITYGTWYCHWACLSLGIEVNGGDCPAEDGMTGGSTVYPLIPCAGTPENCDD